MKNKETILLFNCYKTEDPLYEEISFESEMKFT